MRWPATLVILLVCGVGACSRSTMANYYVLAPHAAEAAGGGEGPSIGISRVVLPGYVDRENIVTNAGPQRLLLDESNLWAEPLDENVTRVLAECLSARLPTDRVFIQPWPHGAVDYAVSVTVLQFAGTLGGEAVLHALWTVEAEADQAPIAVRRSNLRRPAGTSHEEFVAALSEMLVELSSQIAETVPRDASGGSRFPG